MREEEESVKYGARSIVSACSTATKGPSWLVLLVRMGTHRVRALRAGRAAKLAVSALLLLQGRPRPHPSLAERSSSGTKTRELSLRSAPQPGMNLEAIPVSALPFHR